MISNNIKFLLALLVLAGVVGYWYFMPESAPVTSVKQIFGTPSTTTEGKTAAPSKPATAAPASATRLLENGRYVSVVYWTAKGFDPAVVLMNKGEEIRFINKTTLTMRVSFEKSGAPNDISGINQETSVGKDGKYQVAVNDPGTWTFYNLNGDKTKIGVLTVK
jgi:plastocyanin